MTSLEIKFEVMKKWRTIKAGAEAIQTSRSALSFCIWRKRQSPELRERLARALGMTVAELFGDSQTGQG